MDEQIVFDRRGGTDRDVERARAGTRGFECGAIERGNHDRVADEEIGDVRRFRDRAQHLPRQ